jgi:hypothetical protein
MRSGAPLVDEIKSQLLHRVQHWCTVARERWVFWWLSVLYFPAVSCTTMQQPYFVTLCDYSALQSAAFPCATYKTDF